MRVIDQETPFIEVIFEFTMILNESFHSQLIMTLNVTISQEVSKPTGKRDAGIL
jgi:hypothetical protein